MNRLLAILAVLMCACACNFIPLYDLQGNVIIVMDYNLEQQVYVREGFDPSGVASFNEKVHGKRPSNIQVQFYETGTHKLVASDVLESEGGMMSIMPGSYDLLIYSLGTKETQVSGTTLEGLQASTEITASKYQIGNYNKIITEPDHLYLARLENVEIEPVRDDIHTFTTIETKAASILETWTLEMTDVDGMQNIASCELYLTTQEGRSFFWGNRVGNLPGALRLSPYPDFQNRRLYTIFNTFGRYLDYREKVSAILMVTNNAGNEYTFDFDVTDQFDNPDNQGHNLVIDQHIVIPGDSGAGGFEPVVNPWWDPIVITN